MRRSILVYAVSSVLAASVLVIVAPTARAADAAGPELGRLITDPAIWGEDALAAIARIGDWERLGETTIAIYPDKVVSGSKFANAEGAQNAGARLAEEMRRRLPALRTRETDALARAASVRAGRFKTESIRLIEDDSFRFGWRSEGSEFLKPGLSVSSALARYGKPQRTTTEVVHAQGERRPAVLTIHEYASGAVKFVESDLAPSPGVVDRVYLDTHAVAREVYVSQP